MTKRVLLGILLAAGAARAADVSSLIFYDFTHDATKGGSTDGSFNLGRAYFTITGAPAETVSYKLQFDAGQLKTYALGSSDVVKVDSDGDTLTVKSYSLSGTDAGFYAYVKNAYMEWTNPLGKWTFGMQGMNLFNVQEATFGNRFLEKPLMDQHGFSSSADMGVGYAREFGLVRGSVLYTNGIGYKRPENNKYKKLSLQVLAGEPALNKKDGWNAGVVYAMEPKDADYSKSVLGLFGGWAGAGARVGFEFDTMTDEGTTDKTAQIIGFYGDYKLPFSPGLAVFGQLDLYDPYTDSVDIASTASIDESKNNETAIVLGLKYAPVKGLIIAPNLKTIAYEDSDNKENTLLYRINFEFKI